MKTNYLKIGIQLLIVCCLIFQSCEPEPGPWNRDYTGNGYSNGQEVTLCPLGGTDCRRIGDHNDIQEELNRQSLHTFYEYANNDNIKGYFQYENSEALFSGQIPSNSMDEIKQSNYQVRIMKGDSSIVFIRNSKLPTDVSNVIFVLQRGDLSTGAN